MRQLKEAKPNKKLSLKIGIHESVALIALIRNGKITHPVVLHILEKLELKIRKANHKSRRKGMNLK